MADLKKVGLTFKADGSVDFKKSLAEVNAELRANYQEMKLTQESWDKNTKSSEKLKDRLVNLNNAYDLNTKKLETLKIELEELKNSEEATTTQIKNKEAQISSTEAVLKRYEKRIEGVNKKLQSGTVDIEQFGKKLQNQGKNIEDFGKKVAPFSAVAAGMGTAMFGSAIQIDNATKDIIKATGATGKEAEKLKENFKNVFGNTPASAEEVSSAMSNLNTYLDSTDEELEVLTERTLTYARVNNNDAGESASSLGKLINGMGIEFKNSQEKIKVTTQIMDKMTKASQLGGISTNELTDLIIDAGPAFEEMGFDLDKSIGLFASFTKAGANPKEVVGSLNIAMTRMAKAGVTNANEAFHLLLKEIEDAPTIVEATTHAVELFGAKTGGKIADDIQAGRFQIDDWVDAIQSADGTLEKTGKATIKFSDRMSMLKNETSVALEPMGQLIIDILEPLIDKITNLVEWFQNLSPEMQKIITLGTLVVAALAPIIIVIGKVVGAIGLIIQTFAPLIVLVKTAVAAVAAFFGLSVGWLVALGIAVGALVAVVIKYWDEIKEWTLNLVESIVTMFKNLGESISNTFTAVVEFLKNLGESFMEMFNSMLESIWNFIKPFITSIQESWENVVEFLKNLGSSFLEMFKNMIQSIWGFIEPLIQKIINIWNGLADFLKNLGLLFIAAFAIMLEKLWNFFKPFIDNLKNAWTTAINFIKDKLIEPLVEFFTNVFNKILNIIKVVIEKIKSAFEIAKNIINNIIENIRIFITNSFNKIFDVINGVLEKVKNAFNVARNAINNVFENIKVFATNVFNSVYTIINNVITKIKNAFTTMANAVKTVFTGIKDTIKNIFTSIAGIIKTPINGVISAINNVLQSLNKIKIPKWVPVFGGNGIDFKMIPMLAKGGNVLGGSAIVGERGAELLEVKGNRTSVTPLTDGGGATPREIIDYDKLSNAFSRSLVTFFAQMELKLDERQVGQFVRKTVREMI